MSRIPQAFIDDLLARTDIVEIIDARVPLKRAGQEYKACCPFHDEKTPSFYVSPQKQFYHCFGCGAHGTAIGFLMDYERLDFVEAVELLAERLGLKVPREGGASAGPDPNHGQRRQALLDALDAAARWYRQQLAQAAHAIDYLKQRGLDGETAKRFALGYAPPRKDGLLKALAPAYPIELLEQAGLLSEKYGRHHDRFRDRIIFPIRDARGRTIGFGGRVLGDGVPKYLNTNETELFHKGHELYGLYEARQSGGRLSSILIVEGYLDVIGLAQAGIDNAVATLGTATTREHLQRLFRQTSRLIFCFDGDRAGRQAAWRALELAIPLLSPGREAFFLFLPEGEDPDSFVRKHGAEAFRQQIDAATPLSDFLLQELIRRHPGQSMEARAALVESAGQLLAGLEPGALRDQLIDALARETRLSPDRIAQTLDAMAASPGRPSGPPADPTRAQSVLRTPVRTAIALILVHPRLGADPAVLAALPADDALPGLDVLRALLEIVRATPHITTAALLEHWRGRKEQGHLARLLEWQNLPSDEALAKRVLDDALNRIREQSLSKRIEALLLMARRQKLSDEQKRELNTLIRLSKQGTAPSETATH